MVDPVLVSLFWQILILGRVVQVSSGQCTEAQYDTRLMILLLLQVHFVVRLVYNMFVRSYPHLSIIAMLNAKLRAEGHNPHTHAPHAHAD